MKICFFGGYNFSYPRHTILKKGLEENGIELYEQWVWPPRKFYLRYLLLLGKFLSSQTKGEIQSAPLIFVPEFCHKDVPLARFLSLIFAKKVVFDPLASRFETKIADWGRKPRHSLSAFWNRLLDRLSFSLSHLIIADTQAHKEYYCQNFHIPADKVAVIPVGYDDDLFRPRPSPPKKRDDRFTILFYGSFLPLHGAEVIVEAARIIADTDPDVHFLFIGTGQTLPHAKARAQGFSLTNISFEGWIPQDELPSKIAACDICLGLFGRTEKARRVVPHKIFQSMAMEKPVISAKTPAVEEFFIHRQNIFLCSEPYHENLAGAILELKKNESLRRLIASQGRRLVEEKFSPFPLGRLLKQVLFS